MVDYESTDVAHKLLCHGIREDIIKWCAWNDPNGIFKDSDCRLEGLPVLDQRGAQLVLLQFLLVPSYQDGKGVWRDGSRVRIYGLSGTFTVLFYDAAELKDADILTVPVARDAQGGKSFRARITRIIEIDGDPVSLREEPDTIPAADYPHRMLCDYEVARAPV